MKAQDLNTQPSSIILYYKGAFFCSFKYESDSDHDKPDIDPSIQVWIRHPAESGIGYDPKQSSDVKLGKTPNALPKDFEGNIEEAIDVDDHVHNYGYTMFGPNFPQAYNSGGVYLSRKTLRAALAADGGLNLCNDLALIDQTIDSIHKDLTVKVYWKRSPGTQQTTYRPVRYHGFYGTQLNKKQFPNFWLIWHPGTWYSEHCEIPQGTQWRPPRKLWVPDTVASPKAPCTDTDACPFLADRKVGRGDVTPVEPIYLEQNYATYVAELDVPKQPSGSLEGAPIFTAVALMPDADRELRELVEARWPPRDNRNIAVRDPSCKTVNLSVISKYAPGEINKIKRRIVQGDSKTYVEVQEGDTLVEALAKHIQTNAEDFKAGKLHFDNLDIIGHSRSRDNILKVGELAITSRIAVEQFSELDRRGILETLGVTAVRLLGCRTASHPRGRRVVRKIKEVTGLTVYATRTDLFAVHYDESGLKGAAEPLLADDEVVTNYGPGDVPPRDDYPAAPPPDDDDDEYSDPAVGAPIISPPDQFAPTALSDANAALVSATRYLLWDQASTKFAALTAMLDARSPERDNPLLRADYEILLPIATTPKAVSDFRSFDLFLTRERPRVRVIRNGIAFAFGFNANYATNRDALVAELRKMDILVD